MKQERESDELIGVFDSGSGGLTVMRALERELPHQSFLYLGDHGHAPYGNRSPDDIYALTLRSLEMLFDRGCSLVVVACNTAAATGLRQLQQTWLPLYHPSRRVIGVIVPVVEAITGEPWHARDKGTGRDMPAAGPIKVAIFATAHTVRTRAYVTEIERRAPHIRVVQKACPSLVGLIERSAPDFEIRQTVRRYVGQMLDSDGIPDICVLGCTHYPLVESYFASELPVSTRLFSQPEVTARGLSAYLDRHPQFRSRGLARRQFLTTGDARHVSALATRFYGRPVEFESLVQQVR